MSNRKHRTKTALRIALSRLSAIVCLCFCLLLGACATPKIMTFDHAADPKLRQPTPFPANLAVLPLDDRRTRISDEGWVALAGFIPGVPFGVSRYQNEGTTITLSAEEYRKRFRQKYKYEPSGPYGECEIPALLVRYSYDANMFRQVQLLTERNMIGPKFDFQVESILRNYIGRTSLITYGVTIWGALAPLLVGLPGGRVSYEIDLELTLRDCGSGQAATSNRYRTRIRRPLSGLPWGAWIYGGLAEDTQSHWEFETLLPFMRASLEDFVTQCVKALPPPTETDYWSEIAKQRGLRFARAANTPTRIEIAHPPDRLRTDVPVLPLQGDVTSTVGLSSVEVLFNGERVRFDDLSTSAAARRDRVALQLPAVPLRRGENIIQVKARNVADREDSKTLTVVYQPAEPPIAPSPPASSALAASKPVGPRQPPITRPKRWAVVIGISKYKDSQIPRLRYAADDARAFCEWLTDAKGGGYDPTCVKLLLNEKATVAAMRDALWTWLQQPIAEDTVVIYFAGHGSPQSPDQPKNLFLLPYDTDYANIAATAFPMWDVRTAVEKFIKARRVVILADACHSAGVGSEFDIVRRSGRAVTAVPITSGLGDLSNVGAGVVVLTASDEGEFSQEDTKWGGGHGVFTYFLLEGLKGRADSNQDGRVSITELAGYVSEQVRRATRSAQSPRVVGNFDPQLRLGR